MYHIKKLVCLTYWDGDRIGDWRKLGTLLGTGLGKDQRPLDRDEDPVFGSGYGSGALGPDL